MDPKQRYLLNQFKELLSGYSFMDLYCESHNMRLPDSIHYCLWTAYAHRNCLRLNPKEVVGLAFLLRYYLMTNKKIGKYYASSIIDKYSRGRHCKLYNISNKEIDEAMMTIDINEIRKYTNYLIKK